MICRPDLGLWQLAACVLLGCAALLLPAQVIGQGEEAGDLVVEAQALLREGNPVAARARLETALSQGVRRRAVAAAMGEALLAEGKPDQAARWLRPREFSPSTAFAGLRALARLERAEGNLKASGEALDAAITIAPDDAGLWVDVARLRYAGGEHIAAIEAADHAVELAPADPQALLLKGQFVRDTYGVVPALAWFGRAHEEAPGDLVILGELAATLGETGEARAMLDATRRMLALDPKNARAFYLQAVLAARAGNYRLARSLLNRTGNRLDKLPGKLLVQGVSEMALGNHAVAVEMLDLLVKQQPANLRARDLLARALYLAGEYSYLTERFANAARGPDASPYLQTMVARAYEALDDRRSAALYLELAGAGPGDAVRAVPAQGRLGALLASGSYGAAQDLVGGWLGANPQYFDSLAGAGDAALLAGDPRAAAEHYERASRIRLTDALFERRFQALIASGQMREAVALVEARLRYNPRSPAAMRAAGWLAAWSGDWKRGEALYAALAKGEGRRDVQVLADLALVQLNTGKPEQAMETARRAYRIQRANPVATQALAVSLVAAKQQPANARALLAKARRLMGDNALLAEARLKLAELT